MKCINRKHIIRLICLLSCMVLFITGCNSITYDMPYQTDSDVSVFNIVSKEKTEYASPFADRLCVVTGNVSENTSVNLENATSAVLFQMNEKNVIYSKNPHEKLHPASLTKVMTALVALKYGNPNQVLTATNVINIDEKGAQLCGLKVGDTMTMDQALRILLVYSANDVAMLIAESVGGSVENFVELMNEEAQQIGATNSHFANPHGLTTTDHYTTVYDLYLIFNEALKYETINEIIQMNSYQTVYYDKNGKEKKFDKQTTNLFIRGDYQAPADVTVIGGKTGTTSAAGHCLMLLARNVNGAPYIAVVMGVPSTEELYMDMIALLDEIQ